MLDEHFTVFSQLPVKYRCLCYFNVLYSTSRRVITRLFRLKALIQSPVPFDSIMYTRVLFNVVDKYYILLTQIPDVVM